MPVGLVNERSPEGHSGQRKLHEVVGSTETENGKPSMVGTFLQRLKW